MKNLLSMSLGATPGPCISHEEIRVRDYRVAGSTNLFSKPSLIAPGSEPSFTPIIINDEAKPSLPVQKTVGRRPVDSTIPWFKEFKDAVELCYRTIVLVKGNEGYSPEELRLRDYRSGVAKPLRPPYPKCRPFPSNRELVCKPFWADTESSRQAAIAEGQRRVEDKVTWWLTAGGGGGGSSNDEQPDHDNVALMNPHEIYSPEEIRLQDYRRAAAWSTKSYSKPAPYTPSLPFNSKNIEAYSLSPSQTHRPEVMTTIAGGQCVDNDAPWVKLKEIDPDNVLYYHTIVLVRGNERYSPEEPRPRHWNPRQSAETSKSTNLNGGPFARSPETRPFA